MRVKIVTIALVMLMLISSFAIIVDSATVSADSPNDYQYSIINNGAAVKITGYIGAGGDIVIPSSINGLPVTVIGDRSFYGNYNVTSVVIPDSVITIGKSAFMDCINWDTLSGLKSVTIGNHVITIGDNAFESTPISSVIIPNSVITIGNYSFEGMFLKSVIIGNHVTSIGDDAFASCPLTSVVIPDSVTYLGSRAFYYCSSLTSIMIGDHITNISKSAFGRCSSLLSVTIPDSVISIDESAFSWCKSLTSVTIGNGVNTIGHDAFSWCTALSYVILGNNHTVVGQWAFADCTQLYSVNVPYGVTSIENDAFCNCYDLASIDLPDSVTFLGGGAFLNCLSLTSANISNNINLDNYSIEIKYKLAAVFENCPALKYVRVGNNVTSIGQYMFASCTSLVSVTIPENVTYIGDYAFNGCSSLTSMTFNGNAPTVGKYWDLYLGNNFTFYYYKGASGFTTPTWSGMPCVALDPPWPSAPQDVQATSNVDHIQLSWEAPDHSGDAPIATYNIYRATQADGTYEKIGSTPYLSYLDFEVTEYRSYWYKVRAVNAIGEGVRSDGVTGRAGLYSVSLSSQYDGFFLSGCTLDNIFYLKENNVTASLKCVMGIIDGASCSFTQSSTNPFLWTYHMNMGTLSAGNHQLKVTATYNDGYILTCSQSIQMVKPPSWFTGLLGGGTNEVTSEGSTWEIEIKYPCPTDYRDELIKAVGSADIPFIGGVFGIEESYQLAFSIDGHSNIKFSFELETSKVDVGVADIEIKGKMEVEANDMHVVGNTIEWTSMKVKMEIGSDVTGYYPLMGYRTNLFGQDITVGLVARIEVEPSFNIIMNIIPSDDPTKALIDGLGFAIKDFSGQVEVPITIAVDAGIAVAYISGGGTVTLTMGLTSGPDLVESFNIEGELFLKASALFMEATLYDAKGTLYSWSGSGAEANSQELTNHLATLMLNAIESKDQSVEWSFKDRYYHITGYENINWSSDIGQLEDSVYPLTDVSLTMIQGGNAFVFYTTDNISRSVQDGLDVRQLVYDHKTNTWTEIAFPSNDCINYLPKAVIMDDGRIRAVWTSIPYSIVENLSSPLALNSTTLTTGIYDPSDGSWQDVHALSSGDIVNSYAIDSWNGNEYALSAESSSFFGYDTQLKLYNLDDGSSRTILDTQNVSKVNELDVEHGLAIVTLFNGSVELVRFNDATATIVPIPIGSENSMVSAGITSDGQIFVVHSATGPEGSSVGVYDPSTMTLLYNFTGLPIGLMGVKCLEHNGTELLVCASGEGMSLFSYDNGPILIKSWAVANCTQFDAAMSGDEVGITVLGQLPSSTEQPEMRLYYFNTTLYPGAPIGLTATSGNSQVTLTWQAPTDGGNSTRYCVYQNGMSIGMFDTTSATITGLTNGETYSYTVVAYNSFGNGPNSTVVTVVPANPLTVMIISPVNGSYNNAGNEMVSWNINDAVSNIADIEISMDGTNWINVTGNSSYTLSLNDGLYTMHVRAMDDNGNMNEASVTFMVDTVSPTLTIVSPAEGSYTSSSAVTIGWNAIDDRSGIANFLVRVDGGDWTGLDAMNSSTVLNSLSDGAHTIDVEAMDRAGNTMLKTVNVTVDTTPPTITIIGPIDNSYVNSTSAIVSWSSSGTGSPIANTQVKIDAGPWTVTTENTYALSSLSEGSHAVNIRVTDAAGNVNSASVTFTVDTIQPTVTITSPSSGAYLNTPAVTVSWNANDGTSGVLRTEISIDGTTWTIVSGTSAVLTLADGARTIYLRATDYAGNVNETSVNFVVDTLAPSIAITSPSNGANINSASVTVQWTASDTGSGIAYMQLSLDGGAWIQVTGASRTYTFNGLGEGSHNVIVKAVDLAGNVKSSSTSFTIATGPSLTITSPSDGSFVSSYFLTVKWTASDPASGIAYFQIKMDNGGWTRLSAGCHSYALLCLNEGRHTVTVRAVNNAGISKDVSVSFTLDTTPPSLRITSPAFGAIIMSNTATVQWTASDVGSGIAYYRVMLDSGSWIRIPANCNSYTFSGLTFGIHIVTVEAVDNAGNVNDVSVAFLIWA